MRKMMSINGFNVLNDIRGQKFNRLTAILPITRGRNRNIAWKFMCDCGKEVIKVPYDVMRGHIQSCGCLHHDWLMDNIKKPFGEASFNAIYGQYKREARRRKLEFKIDKVEFKKITSLNCYYCGTIPFQNIKSTTRNGDYIYNGIDRLDNSMGYTLDNVVPCCGICNRAKRERTVKDFLSWIEKVYGNTKGQLK